MQLLISEVPVYRAARGAKGKKILGDVLSNLSKRACPLVHTFASDCGETPCAWFDECVAEVEPRSEVNSLDCRTVSRDCV